MKPAIALSTPTESEFLARGLASLDDARRTGEYFDVTEVMRRIKTKLEFAKKLRRLAHR